MHIHESGVSKSTFQYFASPRVSALTMTTDIANLPSADGSDVQSEGGNTDAPPTYQDTSVGWTMVGSPRQKVPARVKCDGLMALTIDFEPVPYPADAWEYESVTALRKAIKDQLMQTKIDFDEQASAFLRNAESAMRGCWSSRIARTRATSRMTSGP